MNTIANLLLLYLGLLLFPTVLSAVLWRRHRTPLHRALFFAWASNLIPSASQVALHRGRFGITLGFSFVFVVNLALAHLIAEIAGHGVRWRALSLIHGLAVGLSAALAALGLPFVWVALPVALSVATPCLATVAEIGARRLRSLSVLGRTFVLCCVLFSLHNVDFAFLRDHPAFAPLGFTIAIMITAWLAITAPAVVLEIVTEREARVAAEVEAARRIQTRFLPRHAVRGPFEVAFHMRPSESVGGDFLDVYSTGVDTWFIVGDVTGHGLGAGLVTLMVQSTVHSILSARPGISPRELTCLANRVLANNLARLGEERSVSVLILCGAPGSDRYTFIGSHETFYVWRAAQRDVQPIVAAHFPLGLGFVEDITIDDGHQDAVLLEPGDLILVATDGVIEAACEGDHTKGLFGEAALIEYLRAHGDRPVDEIKRGLIQQLDAFTSGRYADDVAFMVVRHRSAGGEGS